MSWKIRSPPSVTRTRVAAGGRRSSSRCRSRVLALVDGELLEHRPPSSGSAGSRRASRTSCTPRPCTGRAVPSCCVAAELRAVSCRAVRLSTARSSLDRSSLIRSSLLSRSHRRSVRLTESRYGASSSLYVSSGVGGVRLSQPSTTSTLQVPHAPSPPQTWLTRTPIRRRRRAASCPRETPPLFPSSAKVTRGIGRGRILRHDAPYRNCAPAARTRRDGSRAPAPRRRAPRTPRACSSGAPDDGCRSARGTGPS